MPLRADRACLRSVRARGRQTFLALRLEIPCEVVSEICAVTVEVRAPGHIGVSVIVDRGGNRPRTRSRWLGHAGVLDEPLDGLAEVVSA